MEITVDEALQRGVAAHKEGKLEDAEKLYRGILGVQPNHPDANHNLGVLAAGVGQVEASLPLFKLALEVNPNQEQYWLSYAEALIKLDRLDDARQLLKQGKDAGLKGEQVDKISAQLEVRKTVSSSSVNGTLSKRKRIEALISLYTEGKLEEGVSMGAALSQEFPDDPDIPNILGAIYIAIKEYGLAVKNLMTAVLLEPEKISAINNLGLAYHYSGSYWAAVRNLGKALIINPYYIEALNNIGNSYNEIGLIDDAVANYKMAILLSPNFAGALNNLGDTMRLMDTNREAVKYFDRAIEIKWDYSEAYNNRGLLYQKIEEYEKSLVNFHKAIVLSPNMAGAYSNVGTAANQLCHPEQALKGYKKAISINPFDEKLISSKNFSLNYSSIWSSEFIFKEHLEFQAKFENLLIIDKRRPYEKKQKEKRLRVGYISPDFKAHSVAYFFEPLIKSHNKELVETFCYYNHTKEDEVTRRIKEAADNWRSVAHIGDGDVYNLIKDDQIDILVDLAGHTANHRLLVLARKPAPIQISWLGYPNTTGLNAIDFRLTDAIADPEGESEKFYTEELLRLPGCFLCYAGNQKAIISSCSAHENNGHITFGSFNNLAKVTPEVVKVWAEILRRIPNSNLLIKSGNSDGIPKRYIDIFKEQGITSNRLKLHSFIPDMDLHLALYNKIDIGLDPFPFNGATTTCEALWMGVPIITLEGNRHAGRVGASILTSIGLDNFIAKNKEEYIDLAVELAKDGHYLKTLRSQLRQRMLTSPLCNNKLFASRFEKVLQDIWIKYLDSC